MEPLVLALLYVGGLVGLSLLGFHVAAAMALIGIAGSLYTFGLPVVLNIASLAWATSNEYLLVSVPMFVLMGELLLRAGITDRVYTALSAWLTRIPGGLLHTNIVASAVFAATSGSSVATAATIGTVAMPNMEKRNYDARLALGTIAAGGTLGILIPPSINLILYGAITNTSVGRLFAAGAVPGMALTALFMGVVILLTLAGRRAGEGPGAATVLREKLRMLADLLPVLLIFLVVMGSLYSGFATATEAAALGTVAALCLAITRGQLNAQMLSAAFRSTVRTTGMITLLIVAAFFLNFVLGLSGIPQSVARWVQETGAGPVQTILLLVLVYLLLGCFLETLSMMVTTLPIVAPIVAAQGIDPVWFGIFIVIMCELSLITPPVGMNLYVVQGIRQPGGDVRDVIFGVLPFIACMFALVGLLLAFPELALWLPGLLYG